MSGANSMTRAAYFECFAGASGDMILGALLDAGWPEASFRAALEAVPLGGWEAQVRQVKKGAVHATQVRLVVSEPQPERDVRDIVPIIEASTLETAVKERAIALFQELAEVEGLEHDQPPETVHFHEVGAVDSILDIVGACAGLHSLGIERIFVSPINVGGGIVPTRDGILPVPGPAALELLKRKGAPIYASEYGPEFLTPTGALVLATLAEGFGPFPPMRVQQIGYGAGQKDFAIPNVLRVSIGALDAGWRVRRAAWSGWSGTDAPPGHGPDHAHGREDVVVQLETNIDDMNPQWYGHLVERLLAGGALDVTMIPALMKKGRPGTLLSVLVGPDQVDSALATLFAETTTLGVRIQEVARRTLDRRVEAVETPFGTVRVKLGLIDGTVRSAAPEYDDCRVAALRAGVALRQVYDAAVSAAASLATAD
ncbi:MAG: nickel pincer cofactor biosynthesis protein LarC [Chloroflexota bacterium]